MHAHNGHSHHSHDHRFEAPKNGHAKHNGSSNRKHLSEISHLFLSDLRDDNALPRRHPPARNSPGTVAIVAARMTGGFVRHACAQASLLATDDLANGGDGRVAVALVDAAELRVFVIDANGDGGDEAAEPVKTTDASDLADVLEELRGDVGRWAFALPDPRLPQARRLLGRSRSWTLLTSANHEGVVSGYRTLKGLCELELPEDLADDAGAYDGEGPEVTLAMLDAKSAEDAERSAKKLAGVCGQFLDLSLRQSARDADTVGQAWSATEVLRCLWPTAADAAEAWPLLEQAAFATTSPTHSDPIPPMLKPADAADHADFDPVAAAGKFAATLEEKQIPAIARPIQREIPASPAPKAEPVPEPAPAASMPSPVGEDEVIELPAGESVVDAALAHDAKAGLAITPIAAPMLPSAKVAVDRDGRLVVVAAASEGLGDLALIARATAWAGENRQLLSMALGQYRLSDAPVALRLYVSAKDAGAASLKLLLTNGSADATVCVYRKLRWAGREGLLLEAA